MYFVTATLTAALAVFSVMTLKIEAEVPEAVEKAIKAEYPDAKIGEAEEEKEDGKMIYEVEFTVGKKEYEASITPEGKILEIESEIKVTEIPAIVKKAIMAKYEGATLKEAEELIKEKKVASYEVKLVTKEEKTMEVVFDAKGKFVKEEEEKEEKDDDGQN